MNPPAQTRLHQLVVKRYGDKCNGSYAKLQDDKYVFQKLMTHLASAGYYELLGNLMTHLRWLMAIVQYGDANTYLANYRYYRTKLPTQVTNVCVWGGGGGGQMVISL